MSGITRIALAAASAPLLCSLAPAHAAAITYTDGGAFQAASYSEGGVLLTSSGTLRINQTTLGVGVLGGGSDRFVDPAGTGPDEYLVFEAEGDTLFSTLALNFAQFSNTDGGSIDSYIIEGFDTAGAGVAVYDYRGNAGFVSEDLVARLGAGPLDKVRVTAAGDSYEVYAIQVTLVPVPEPGTLGLLAAAGLALARRQRRR